MVASPCHDSFQDEKGNEYHCPLGKKLVDFADESHFSRIAMYLGCKTQILHARMRSQAMCELQAVGQVFEGKGVAGGEDQGIFHSED